MDSQLQRIELSWTETRCNRGQYTGCCIVELGRKYRLRVILNDYDILEKRLCTAMCAWLTGQTYALLTRQCRWKDTFTGLGRTRQDRADRRPAASS